VIQNGAEWRTSIVRPSRHTESAGSVSMAEWPDAAAGRRRGAASARGLAALLVVVALLGAPSFAAAEEYNPHEAGHPLRIAAYIVHPVGVALDYLIMRPAWWVGSHEPFRTLFGREDYY